ncbi:hypothetical protein NQZ68_014899 [Dissostichus eleginoides]|nr:hypothetical protein NQZ68_014899 [Dissostichus eleginoides]
MVHIQTNPDKHLPSVAFNSPTKQANKKDIYTRRDHFCLRATPQPKDDITEHFEVYNTPLSAWSTRSLLADGCIRETVRESECENRGRCE